MKALTTLAAVCLAITLAGCSSTSDTEASSLGAVSECGVNCEEAGCMKEKTCGEDCAKACCSEASPGAVKDAPSCGSEKSSECPITGSGASLGAVGDGSSCSSSKASSCQSSCSSEK